MGTRFSGEIGHNRTFIAGLPRARIRVIHPSQGLHTREANASRLDVGHTPPLCQRE